MLKNTLCNAYQPLIIFSLFLSGIATIVPEKQAQAQIIPDKTLSDENSVVTPVNPQLDRIDGGAIRGSNLFHSFTEFNIGEGREAYFSNPAAIENIFSRVTGSNPSRIFGKLGVLGDANLFFLNPKGIIFGENSSLDIKGSFFASTGNSIDFGNDNKYSAINPTAPPLLSVNVKPPIGLEFENGQGDINSQGNLSVGKNLNLNSKNLNLQGRLQAGKDLTLKAETVTVRDSLEKPFMAAANGNLSIQGKKSVDIFALNHPSSGLFSAGNMTLSSANPVIGDIHFWSGGNFQIEKLDKTKGDLFSFYDPIIRSQGDVSIFGYQGASLHILAGGKVDINTAIITNPDITGASINPVSTPNLANVTLSDDTSLVIDGSQKPTLDIRAGLKPSVIGNPLGTLGNAGTFFDASINPVASPSNNPVATSADITIGDAIINPPNGIVLLTNQYEPNLSLPGGDITVNENGAFGIGIDARGFGGNGGDVFLDSRGEITLNGKIDTSSVEDIGNGGYINLLADKNIMLTSNSPFLLNSRGLSGGQITLKTRNDIFAKGNSFITTISTGSQISGSPKPIGNINIIAKSFFAQDGIQILALTTGKANAGDVNINIKDDLSFDSSFIASVVGFEAEGNGGNLNINTNSFNMANGTQLFSSTLGKGNAGNMNIQANDSVIFNGSNGVLFSGAFSTVEEGATGNGGEINIKTNSLSVTNGAVLDSSTLGTGNAGNIRINADGSVLFDGIGIPFDTVGGALSRASNGSLGEGGSIFINAESLSVTNGAQLISTTRSQGNAGNIFVNVRETALFKGIGRDGFFSSAAFSAVEPTGFGNGGNIEITAKSLLVSEGASLSSSTFGNGKAGNLIINASETVLFDGIGNNGKSSAGFSTVEQEAGARGEDLNIFGGDISITAKSLIVSNGAQLQTLTRSRGNAGNVDIDVQEIILKGVGSNTAPSGIFTIVGENGIGKAGDIEIKGEKLLIEDGARLISSTLGKGDAGKIKINTTQSIELNETFRDEWISGIFSEVSSGAVGNAGSIEISTDFLSILNSAQISTSTFGEGKAGSIEVTANILQANNNSQLLTTTSSKSQAGNITLNIKDNLTLSGKETGVFANTAENSTGDGGSIIIDPQVVNIFDGAEISVDSQGLGIGGDIELAAGKLNLNNGTISAKTRSNTGGNITLNIQDLLLLRNRSEISTTAGEEKFGGDGGNIKINIPDGFIVAFPNENSDITANAFSGNGGNVDITAFGIFGIEFRDKLTAFSDITASSELGFDGNVNIETPGIEPNPETVELPEDVRSTEVAQGCQASGEAAVAFFDIGRGGLEQQPGETLRSDDAIASWVPLILAGESRVDEKVSRIADKVKEREMIFARCQSKI
ncbi:MAG: filamentous hemagglutinin N-terminal domain-containing protein [Rivularia sp. (in: Bacteria)]|nr:filamentous hemagglutinin N-terminal domain-containing protein [Rivularia sp. MS3]